MRTKPKRLNRWRKPRLYLTLVGIALPVALTLSCVFFAIGLDSSFVLMEDDPDLWLAGFIPFSAYGWLLILSLPTGLGAAELLFARKTGIFISLGLLPLLAITLGMSVFSMMRSPQADMITKVLIDLSIASVMTMLGPLILGWKRIHWKSSPARRTERVNAIRKRQRP